MEDILLRVGSQAANFAIRSGLGYASKFAFVQMSKYIQGVPDELTPELEKLRKRLENKIKIVTPAIDLIERIAARGNTSLSSTVQLTTALRHDINEFGKTVGEAMQSRHNNIKVKGALGRDVLSVQESMKDLLRRIEDAVPLISLALTTSGANLSSSLPDTVSPSRLLQASFLIRSADDIFEAKHETAQVGPTFIVKFYSIFTAHARVSTIKDIQWKEEYAKCRVSVARVPSRAHKEDKVRRNSSNGNRPDTFNDGYEYELRLVEDFDDGRYHEELEGWSEKQIRSVVSEKGYIEGRVRQIPVYQIARLFYEHAGILLNLGESLSPVLIAKIQHGAPHPQNVLENFTNPQDTSIDALDKDFGLNFEIEDEEEPIPGQSAWMGDIEWIAFEAYQDDESDSEEDDDEELDDKDTNSLVQALSTLDLESSSMTSVPSLQNNYGLEHQHSSLSLLEYVLRLAALQTFEQQSHMHLTDEHIVLFLRDDNPASRQQQSVEQERTLRRRSSGASITSDFSSRAFPNGVLPISPPRSEEPETPVLRASSPTATSPAEADKPVIRNPRSHLERAMAADYDPMTLTTPLSNRRVTRSGIRRKITGLSGHRASNLAPSVIPKDPVASGERRPDVRNTTVISEKEEADLHRRSTSKDGTIRNGRVVSRSKD